MRKIPTTAIERNRKVVKILVDKMHFSIKGSRVEKMFAGMVKVKQTQVKSLSIKVEVLIRSHSKKHLDAVLAIPSKSIYCRRPRQSKIIFRRISTDGRPKIDWGLLLPCHVRYSVPPGGFA